MSEYEKMIAIITAQKNGKTIQLNNANNEWVDNSEPVFNFQGIEYRIKPERKSVWCLYYDGILYKNAFSTFDRAERSADRNKSINYIELEIVEMTEVIDE